MSLPQHPRVAYLFLVRSHTPAVAPPHMAGGSACERVRPLRLAERRVRSVYNGKFSRWRWHEAFLRRANAPDAGVLLAKNGRWVDAKWSPDSHFLAVIDHPDGHIADVYVFGVTAANAAASPSVTLFYHTPNPLTYDVRWDVAGWHAEKHEVVLKQEVRDQNAGTHATHTVVAQMGEKPLKFELPK
jgi:hypothetical protein